MTVPALTCSITAAAPDRAASEVLVLGPSLGTTTALWEPVLESLRRSGAAPQLRILRFDLPGHGASPATRQPFTMGELADAVVRLVDQTGGGRFHYAGDSLGGAIGLELAVRHPSRLLSLGLFCTGARIGTPQSWVERATMVRAQGTPALVAGSSTRWFAEGFIAREPDLASYALSTLQDVDDESYALCAEALAGFDRRADLPGIDVPTLAVGGAEDVVTPAAELAADAERMPRARFVEIAAAAHLVPLERPGESAALLAELVASVVDADGATRPAGRAHADGATRPAGAGAGTDADAETLADRRALGDTVRREVLGDAHVDAAATRITAETADFQEFITRYAWGEIWARPGLDRAERSIATLASLVTAGHETEIRMHVRAALRNGLTREQISEVILHTALYAGLPAANAAFGIAREVFAEDDASA